MTLRDKMLAVIADVNASVAEREELVEMIAIALLTRKNLFVLGEPGQAKSYAINLFRQHITGARQFERLLSKQSDEEQLFGRVDLASLLPGSVPPTVLEQDATYQNQRFNLRVLVEGIGSMKDEPATWEKLKSGTEKLELYRAALSALHKSEPTVQTAGKIPEADIVLLDEIFKCNDGVLNSLLTALNERKYTNEGRTYPIPVISFFAASNEIPNFNDPQEKILEALYDRLELKVVTANMEDRDTRLAVLKNKQAGTFGQVTVTITLEELRQMQQEVASILVPDAINELADDILCELRKDMTVSDRKYLGYAHGDGQGHTPGRVSNKTLYIALNYKEQAERLNTEAAETIAAELFVLEHEHERLKLYISLIDKREAEVLMLLYSEKESAVNVAERLGYSKRTITRIHNAAVAHLAEMYEYAEKYDG